MRPAMGSGGALIFKPAKWQGWLEILPFETRLTIALLPVTTCRFPLYFKKYYFQFIYPNTQWVSRVHLTEARVSRW